MSSSNQNVTMILNHWQTSGDKESLDKLVSIVYTELHKLASAQIHKDSNATIQCTELISEAYVKLIDSQNIDFKNRNHFFSIAAKIMRRVLIERFRRRNSEKRGSQSTLVTYKDQHHQNLDLDLVQLDDALNLLEKLDPRQAEIVTLKFFGGLKVNEISHALEISESTVKREWQMARMWLFQQMKLST